MTGGGRAAEEDSPGGGNVRAADKRGEDVGPYRGAEFGPGAGFARIDYIILQFACCQVELLLIK